MKKKKVKLIESNIVNQKGFYPKYKNFNDFSVYQININSIKKIKIQSKSNFKNKLYFIENNVLAQDVKFSKHPRSFCIFRLKYKTSNNNINTEISRKRYRSSSKY